MWTGPKTAVTSSPTQETTRSSSVRPLSCHLHHLKSNHCCKSQTQVTFVCKSGIWEKKSLETLSGEASSGKHVTNMDTVRNVEWATSTCTLSFNTFGRLIKRRLQHFARAQHRRSHFWVKQNFGWMLFFFLRNLARRSRRHRHQRRVQVTWRIPAGVCWWLWQSALVLLPLLSAKGQSCSLTQLWFFAAAADALTSYTPRAEQQNCANEGYEHLQHMYNVANFSQMFVLCCQAFV